MTVPENTKTYESELATFWLDKDGILCAMSKMTPRTIENQKATYALIREITHDQRVCLLSDNSYTYEQDDTLQKYMVNEIPKVFKAMAVISRTVFSQAVLKTFIHYNGQPVPIKMFDNEVEAREWLIQFLHA